MHPALTYPPDRDRLFKLLPYVIQRRDSEQGWPLRALLQVINEQVDLLEVDCWQRYENWFIETCEPWVVPYIADLIGHQAIGEAADAEQDAGSAARNAVLLPRREVAHTLGYRRRKGTLQVLMDLARDVAGWPARAVEAAHGLAQTPSVRMPPAQLHGTADLRDIAKLSRLGSAFDTLTHSNDVRRPPSHHQRGRWGRDSVDLFLWRLQASSVTRAPAACLEQVGPHCYTFSVLGNDAPLFNHPLHDGPTSACHLPGELDVPQALSRRLFAAPAQAGEHIQHPSPDYYGLGTTADGQTIAQSVAIWASGWPDPKVETHAPIPASSIIVADLDGWQYQPPRNHIALDPERGRIAFPPRQLPKRHVLVSYYHGTCADIGGGEYPRELLQHPDAIVLRVNGAEALHNALGPWLASSLKDTQASQPQHAVIELEHSGVYAQPIHIKLAAGHTLQLRAASGARPVLRLLDWQVDRPDDMVIDGEAGSRFTLDGILLAGRGLQVQGPMASVSVRHSTLVPGWSLEPNCDPKRPSEPSIELIDSSACLIIEHSIVGSIQVNNDEVTTDPISILISDSIVDATGANCENTQCEAIGAPGSRLAFAHTSILRCTVIGRVMTHAIDLAEDSLFMGRVTVARRQIGCMRFCYVTPGSRTPRRYECQPDGVEAAIDNSTLPDTDKDAAKEVERLRVRPVFDSTRYGTPTYARLAPHCAREITNGAHDESEMGVYHDLYQPQRLRNLRQRVDEFSPAGAQVGIVLAN